MKNVKTLLLSTALLSAGAFALSTQADASEVNTVDTIKAEMHKQQGNKQKLAVYRVQKGDTLSRIAEAADLTIDQILAMNDIPNPNLIHIGQLINLGYSAKANNFVAKTGQSVQNNAQSYVVPMSPIAQASMNATKEVATQPQKQASYNNTNQALTTQQVQNTNIQTISSQPTNQYQLANQPVQQKPVYNNGGQTAQSATNGNVNHGSNNAVNNTPATAENQTQQPQKPTTPNKPTNSGQTNTGNTTQKPSQPEQKPVNNGSQNTENQPQYGDYNYNYAKDVNKFNQGYKDAMKQNGWTGTWVDKAPNNVPERWGSGSISTSYHGNKNANEDGKTRADIDYDSSMNQYTQGYIKTNYNKDKDQYEYNWGMWSDEGAKGE